MITSLIKKEPYRPLNSPMAPYRLYMLFFLITIFLLSIPSSAATETTSVIIGTGQPDNSYYSTGTTIAKLLTLKPAAHNLRAKTEATAGSVFNINGVMAGDFAFGIVPSDRVYQAFKGLAEWRDKGPQKKLRSVFSVHPELITLCATVFSGVSDIQDLKGKRVNIGNPGSGQRQNSIDALQAVGIDWQKDLKAEGAKATEAPGLIQDGRIDAFFYTADHPNDAFKEATQGDTRVRFITITGIETLLATYPYYTKAHVPIAFYPKAVNDRDVETFGIKANFVTSIKVPKAVVYTLTKEVFENFEWFKKQRPAYKVLTKENMLEGLSAPIHPGAMQYYKEVGLK